jgi:hypothetical protein
MAPDPLHRSSKGKKRRKRGKTIKNVSGFEKVNFKEVCRKSAMGRERGWGKTDLTTEFSSCLF